MKSAVFISSMAATQFVSGVSDGLSAYVILRHNSAEYRADQMGVRSNELMWNELSAQDRKALLNVYGWQTNRRTDHFGSIISNAMADWINQEQGWTAEAEKPAFFGRIRCLL
jgi:hypothetical protein